MHSDSTISSSFLENGGVKYLYTQYIQKVADTYITCFTVTSWIGERIDTFENVINKYDE